MAKPAPQGGLVIRYDYLWLAEERNGREEGAKARPCAIVVAVQAVAADPLRAIVCGITHARPMDDEGIRIPPAVKVHLGLDAEESWIVTSEVNLVDWDDPGIVPVARGRWAYGFLPPALAKAVRERIVAQLGRGRCRSSIGRRLNGDGRSGTGREVIENDGGEGSPKMRFSSELLSS